MKLGPVFHTLGLLLIILGAFMIAPVPWAIYYNEATIPAISFSAFTMVFVGFVMWKYTPRAPTIGIREGFGIVAFGWILMILAGALPFYFTGAIPSITDSIFESASGFSGTGASILVDIEALPKSVLFWRSFTHWLGGMGFIILSLAILPILGIGGMQLFRAESAGPTKDKLTPRVRQTAKLLWGVYLLFSAIMTILLLFGGMNLLDALCHMFGAMGTGGYSTRNASVAAFHSAYIDWVIIAFLFIAAINFGLHFRALSGKPLNYFKDPEFRFFVGVLLSAIAIIYIWSYGYFESPGKGFRDTVFQVMSVCTTTGYVTADYEKWHPISSIVLLLLMFMGGMAGSTAGAIKMVRWKIIFHQIRIEVRRLIHPHAVYPLRLGDKVIPEEVVKSILGFALLYISSVTLGALFLVALGVDYGTSFSASITCMAGCGPGINIVGPVGNYSTLPALGKLSLSVEMYLGRLELLTAMVLLSRSFWKK